MPIGLSEGGREAPLRSTWPRSAGPATKFLFPTPSRPVLAAETYEEACAAHQVVTGTKISKQAWFLIPKSERSMTFFRAIHMVGLGSESVIQSWLSPGSMEVSLLRIPKSIRLDS